MAITRTQRSERFRRVVLERPQLAPIGFVCETLVVIEPAAPTRSIARPRPTLSYLERVPSRRVPD